MLKCRDLHLCPDETAVHVDFVIALLLSGTLLQKKKNFKIYKKLWNQIWSLWEPSDKI